MLFLQETQDLMLQKLLPSLVIKGADDLNLEGGLGVTNRRVCVDNPLSGVSKSQVWVLVLQRPKKPNNMLVGDDI